MTGISPLTHSLKYRNAFPFHIIYVNGRVEFNGVDAKINSLMYVNHGASIRYSKINGLEKDGEEGSLIIFANGRIHFANNSLHQNDSSRNRGFFYFFKCRLVGRISI